MQSKEKLHFKEIKENGTIDWKLMEKRLGWDKLDNSKENFKKKDQKKQK